MTEKRRPCGIYAVGYHLVELIAWVRACRRGWGLLHVMIKPLVETKKELKIVQRATNEDQRKR